MERLRGRDKETDRKLTVMESFYRSKFWWIKYYDLCLIKMTFWCNDTQYNDTEHNDTLYNDTQYNGTQYNDTQHNDTQYNDT